MFNREFENGNELTAEAGLTDQFARLAHFLRREKMRSFLDGDREDAWRKRLLHMIKMHPGMKAAELTAQLSGRMPAAEEVLLGLAHKGYIIFEAGSSEKTVELTDLGKKEAAEFIELGGAFDVLSEEEKTTMAGYLARINAELQKKAGSDGEVDDMFPGFGGMQDGAGFDRMRKLHEFFMRRMEKRGPHGGFDPRCGWGGF
jgi:DNA-binding MarR family transcriptional regulator